MGAQLRWQSARLACERYRDRYPVPPEYIFNLLKSVHARKIAFWGNCTNVVLNAKINFFIQPRNFQIQFKKLELWGYSITYSFFSFGNLMTRLPAEKFCQISSFEASKQYFARFIVLLHQSRKSFHTGLHRHLSFN